MKDWWPIFVRKIIAPLWALEESTNYLNYLKYLEKSQYFPIDRIQEIQLEKLKKLVNHAYNNCEYYRDHFGKAGVNPGDIKELRDIKQIPLLSKDDIRNNLQRMIAKNIPKEKMVKHKTSGSTGVSLEFFVDKDSLEWKRACTIRHNRWAGWDIGDRFAAIWGNPGYKKNFRLWIRNFILERGIYLDTLQMIEDDMFKFYQKLQKWNSIILFGHAHSIYLFAKFFKRCNLEGIRPRGIISTAMVLHDFERREIEEVFGCRVTNRYGCEEVSLIASECGEHNGLHINMDTNIVEFLKNGKDVSAGQAGAIVVTDLSNYGMPFIRYKIGDVGIPSELGCLCGRRLPLLERVEGREADYIMTPEGKLISGISLTENFALRIPGVRQMQILQEKSNYLIFRIVKEEEFNERGRIVLANLANKYFGSGVEYDCEFVESIQQEESGKYRFVISKLTNIWT